MVLVIIAVSVVHTGLIAQQQCPVIRATSDVAVIKDGLRIEMKWHLDPKARPDVPLTEVGNMAVDEDLIVGNAMFLDRIIEIDYEKRQLGEAATTTDDQREEDGPCRHPHQRPVDHRCGDQCG